MSSNILEEKKNEIEEIKKKNFDILTQYNQAKKKYSLFFEKAIEIEHELSEHNLVANTLSKLNDNRRCFRKVGDNLIEKDLGSIKKDLNIEIANIKQTLDIVYRTMTQQENILNEYEQKYNDLILPALKDLEKQEEENNKKDKSGVIA